MFCRGRFPFLAIFLMVHLHSIIGGKLGVSVPSGLCALTGSSVIIFCTYTYPPKSTVGKAHWLIGQNTNLMQSEGFKNRVMFLGDKNNNCTLKINGLRESDTKEKYRFHFTTTNGDFEKAVNLSLTALQVMISPTTVKEGQSVTLTCSSTCRLSNNPTYIWYKNGLPVSTALTFGNTFSINKVSISDAGQYSCAVTGHEGQSSSTVRLSVRYGPQNMSISVSPPGDIIEGSSVTITCSSHANPPVQCYTWYRKSGNETLLVGPGQNYTITNISESSVYFCLAKNEVGVKESSSLVVDVKYAPRGIIALLSRSTNIPEGLSVTLTCSSDANPPVHSYVWYKKSEADTLLIASRQNYSITAARVKDSGQYYCKAENKIGVTTSLHLHLNVYKEFWRLMIRKALVFVLSSVFIVLTVALSNICWSCFKSRKAIPVEEGGATDNEMEDLGPIYGNISLTPTALATEAPKADRGDEDDVLYATVQFTRRNTENCGRDQCTQEQTVMDEDVQYTTVNFSVLTSDAQSEEDAIYSNQPAMQIYTNN